MDEKQFTAAGINAAREALDIFEQAANGELSEENAIEKTKTLVTKTSLDAMEHLRSLADYLTETYVSGDLDTSVAIAVKMNQLSKTIGISLMHQAKLAKDEAA